MVSHKQKEKADSTDQSKSPADKQSPKPQTQAGLVQQGPATSPKHQSPEKSPRQTSAPVRSPNRSPRQTSPGQSPNRSLRQTSPGQSPNRSPRQTSASVQSPNRSPRQTSPGQSPNRSPRQTSTSVRSPNRSPRQTSPTVQSLRQTPKTPPKVQPQKKSPRQSSRTSAKVQSQNRSPKQNSKTTQRVQQQSKSPRQNSKTTQKVEQQSKSPRQNSKTTQRVQQQSKSPRQNSKTTQRVRQQSKSPRHNSKTTQKVEQQSKSPRQNSKTTQRVQQQSKSPRQNSKTTQRVQPRSKSPRQNSKTTQRVQQQSKSPKQNSKTTQKVQPQSKSPKQKNKQPQKKASSPGKTEFQQQSKTKTGCKPESCKKGKSAKQSPTVNSSKSNSKPTGSIKGTSSQQNSSQTNCNSNKRSLDRISTQIEDGKRRRKETPPSAQVSDNKQHNQLHQKDTLMTGDECNNSPSGQRQLHSLGQQADQSSAFKQRSWQSGAGNTWMGTRTRGVSESMDCNDDDDEVRYMLAADFESQDNADMTSERQTLTRLKPIAALLEANFAFDRQTQPPTRLIMKPSLVKPVPRIPISPYSGSPSTSYSMATDTNHQDSGMRVLRSSPRKHPSSRSATPTIKPLNPSPIKSTATIAGDYSGKFPFSSQAKTTPCLELFNSKKAIKTSPKSGANRRLSVRQTECAFKYKEIVVKKMNNITQVILNGTSNVRKGLNPQAWQELTAVLNNAKYDDTSQLVLLTGSGTKFCSGLDLQYLTTGDIHKAAKCMAESLTEFVNVMLSFPKPVVAAVNGQAVGCGVGLLLLCDIVYASDKATFFTPYAQLSHTPELCLTRTLPQAIGSALASEMLMAGRMLTALEAYQMGLVAQVFWPTSMMEEVIPRLTNMSVCSGKILNATKAMLRSHQRQHLLSTNNAETKMLIEIWPTSECQRSMKAYLEDFNDLLS